MNHLDFCPFCKSEDIAIELRYDGLYIPDSERQHPRRYIAYSAICNKCGARGPIVTVKEANRSHMERYFAVETAAALWNRNANIWPCETK